MSKILVLELDNEYGMLRNADNIDYYNYFKYSNKNIVQKIIKKLELNISSIFFNEWKNKIEEYDTVIMFDRVFNKVVTRYIKHKNPYAKIILWLWNPVSDRQKYFMTDNNVDEIWTYDKNDAQKYNIKYNTQFYNKMFLLNRNTTQVSNDIMFIGANKGRKETIEKWNNEFKKHNLVTDIKIVEKNEQGISYQEYLKRLEKTKCIFEIVNDGVEGLTLRALESIFFEKKIITNNKEIIKYNFYNPNNIFILEYDDIDKIEKFINSNYVKIEKETVEFYEYEKWVSRFIK